MSQRTLFALCLVAAVLVLASAQRFDYDACTRNARRQIDNYRESVMKAFEELSTGVQGATGQALDISNIQSELDTMVQSFNSLTNLQNGIDVGRVTQVYMENLQSIVRISRSLFRPEVMSGSTRIYLRFVRTLTNLNLDTASRISESCMPSV